MRAFLSNLTALLLIVHAMFGCCRHHWQSDTECAAATTICAESAPGCGHCCCSHDEDEQPSEPCSGGLECQGVCTYLPTSKTVVDASAANNAFDFAAIAATLLDGRLAVSVSPWARAHAPDDSPPRLRLHLLHQSLLI
jgi:hypothetical protein